MKIRDQVAEVVFNRGVALDGLFEGVNAVLATVADKLTQSEYIDLEDAINGVVGDAAERGFILGVQCMQNPASVFLEESNAQDAF